MTTRDFKSAVGVTLSTTDRQRIIPKVQEQVSLCFDLVAKKNNSAFLNSFIKDGHGNRFAALLPSIQSPARSKFQKVKDVCFKSSSTQVKFPDVVVKTEEWCVKQTR